MVKKVSIWLSLEPLLYGKRKHLSEIARELNLPHTTVRKHMEYFKEKGIVNKKIIGRQTFYYLKKTLLVVDCLVIVEKERTLRFAMKNALNKYLIEKLHELMKDGVLVLFGSYVYDEEASNDVDILIVGHYDKKKLNSLENIINKKFHITHVKSLDSVDEILKREILENHIIVEGSEKVIKWLLN